MRAQQSEPGPPERPRTWRRRVCRGLTLYVVVPYLAVTVIFAVFQRRLMYRPTVAADLRVAAAGLDTAFGSDMEIPTADGATLRGWLVHGAGEGRGGGRNPLVLYFPGNSLNRRERVDDLREVASRGFDVLIVDYRGFGDSTGAPTEAALSADARLVWRHARETLGYDESRTVIFGESLGGAVALSLWSDANPSPPKPAALILSSTFASMPRAVAWHYPLFPFQFLLLDRWPSIGRIGRVRAPIVVFHGAGDEMIPVEHGRSLAAASERARFVEIPGGLHNDVPMTRLRRELDTILAGLPDPDAQAIGAGRRGTAGAVP